MDPSGLVADANGPNDSNHVNDCNHVWKIVGSWPTYGFTRLIEKPWGSWGPWMGYTVPMPCPFVDLLPGLCKTLRFRIRTQSRKTVWYRYWETKWVCEKCGKSRITRELRTEGIIKWEYRQQTQTEWVYHWHGRIFFRKAMRTRTTLWLSGTGPPSIPLPL